VGEKGLNGDPAAIYMACPEDAARQMTATLPPGRFWSFAAGLAA